MVKKYSTVFRLLFCAFPAGFFPVVTLATIWSIVHKILKPIRSRIPESNTTEIVAAVVFAAIAALALFVFVRAIGRAKTSEANTLYNLSSGAWTSMLWGAFAVGLAFGVAVFAVSL